MGREEQLNALSDRLASLQDAAALVDIYSDLEDTDQALVDLPAELEAIRLRGYVFSNYLERKIEVLTDQWNTKREEVVQAIERRSRELAQEIDQAERALEAAYSGGSGRIGRAENAINQLESKVSAAQDVIEDMFETIDENVTQVMRQIEHIDWVLDQAAEASFAFYEGEDFVSACQAQLVESGEEGPKGILHLTDERLVLEQKEEVATKKILFITTEKELVQEMVFEALVGHVQEVNVSDEGLLGRKEMMQILFAPEARYGEVNLRLRGADNQAWAQLIERVRSGDIERERIRVEGAPEAQTMELQANEIPTDCPNCGATFTQPIVQGMREITCEYCGTIVRI
jgi:DNA repair exonuclease SbcCD ATPase subunit